MSATYTHHPLYPREDYSGEELELIRAMDRYKHANRRPYPTLSEVLAVVVSLGYRRVAEPTDLPRFAHSSGGGYRTADGELVPRAEIHGINPRTNRGRGSRG